MPFVRISILSYMGYLKKINALLTSLPLLMQNIYTLITQSQPRSCKCHLSQIWKNLKCFKKETNDILEEAKEIHKLFNKLKQHFKSFLSSKA